MAIAEYVHLYRHKETEGFYVVLHRGEMKVEMGIWVNSVTYKCCKTNKIYTRSESSFTQGFELVAQVPVR